MSVFPAKQVKSLMTSRSLRARFGLALLVALAIHLPATPVMMLFSFFSTLLEMKDSERADYDAGTMTISVDLEPPAKPPAASQEKVDAVQMESEHSADAVKIPKGEERQTDPKADQPEKDPSTDAQEQKKKPAKKTPEELGLTGDMNASVQGKTNVTLTLWFSTMRDYPAADAMRPMFSCGFIGSVFQRAGIDPIQDLEGALFAGQQLNDPAKYMVAVHHRMGKEQVHDAIDKLVQLKGTWLDDQAATFYAAKAQRVVFPHGATLLFVTPEPGWRQIRAITKPLAIPTGRGRALSVNLLKPSIPFRKLGLRLPESIVEMRLDIFLSVTGTSEVQLRFEDRDAKLAEKHAPEISDRLKDFLWQAQRVSDLSGLLAPSSGASVDLPEIPMVADERAVVGQVKLSQDQTIQFVAKISALLCAKQKAAPHASASAKSPSAPPAPASASSGP